MHLNTLKNVTQVSSAAIQNDMQGAFVYVVTAEKMVQIRRITIGATDGDKVAISANLAPNEMVVLEGIDKLHEGSAVEIVRKDGKIVAAEMPVKKVNSADKSFKK